MREEAAAVAVVAVVAEAAVAVVAEAAVEASAALLAARLEGSKRCRWRPRCRPRPPLLLTDAATTLAYPPEWCPSYTDGAPRAAQRAGLRHRSRCGLPRARVERLEAAAHGR